MVASCGNEDMLLLDNSDKEREREGVERFLHQYFLKVVLGRAHTSEKNIIIEYGKRMGFSDSVLTTIGKDLRGNTETPDFQGIISKFESTITPN